MFGVKVYDSKTQNLGWCFWVGIAAISCQLIALALIIVYALIIMYKFSFFLCILFKIIDY